MIYIVFVSAIVVVFGGELIPRLHFRPDLIMQGEFWRIITWIFIPIGGQNIIFAAITLYFYFFIGSTLEKEWGTAKFTIFYLSGAILTVVYGLVLWFTLGVVLLIVPMFLNLSMFFAFAVLFPDHVVRLFFFIPIKIKWLALFNAAFFLYNIITALISSSILVAILPLVALLNFFIICGEDAIAYLRPIKARTSPQTINFKKAAKQARRNQMEKPYRHKCEVCGKTDTEYPDLEFRYCSRCNGYHCFCIDHINNHVHFQ